MMADLDVALISLGKLIAILENGGAKDGHVRWTWFSNPPAEVMKGLPENREQLGAIVRALLGRPPAADQPFDTGLAWEPINLGDDVEAGFVWTKAGALRIGVGARADFTLGGKALDLSVLARLVSITTAGDISSDLGKLTFSGKVPTPDFLQSATVNGEIDGPVDLTLTVVDADGRLRKVELAGNQVIAWDAARLVTFVLQAWIRQQAAGASDSFFQRVDEHLFPMLGDPETPAIKSFPLVGDTMGKEFTVGPWKDSVLSAKDGGAGALTFLWHLRALLTGNEDPEFFKGSFWLPLIGGSSQGTPPSPTDPPAPFAPGPDSAWVGITDANQVFSLVLDLRDGGGVSHPITLAMVQGGTLTRPGLAGDFDLSPLLSSFPMEVGGGKISVTQALSGVWHLRLAGGTISGTGLTDFDGDYDLELRLTATEPVDYRLVTPAFELALPPSPQIADGQLLFATMAQWLLSAVPGEAGSLADISATLGQTIRDAVDPAAPVNAAPLIDALVSRMDADSIGLDVSVTGTDPLKLGVTLPVGPLEPGSLGDLPIHIGKIVVQGDVALGAGSAVENFSVGLFDLRMGAAGGGEATGLLASLLPDLRDVPGFSLTFTTPDSLVLAGGGKIPLQHTIGPLDLVALLVDLRKTSLRVGIDLSFELAMIRVTAFELGVEFPFSNAAPVPFLHGLGVSCDTDFFKLAGMFARNGTNDYVGGAVVSLADVFELSAIGGYTEVEGQASLFVFASLVAPLGGPPWFFVTGIAGGFGYNRALPAAGLLTKHPFMQVMSGEMQVAGEPAGALAGLSAHFPALPGNHWVAAGIQFTCFGFIQGKVVVGVSFGQKFSINILGLAAFGIEPVAYFEIGIEATADEEQFVTKAGLSSNSYIIHPDIFSLRGDFALGVWHGGDHAGDFVLSIGGFHPYFTVPEHYGEAFSLNRVGCTCTVYGFVRMSVDGFFACTPQAIMAGASLSLSAEFADIAAGLDVYVDVFIQWDPFKLRARMGIVVWFEFMGRHEIGVELSIHTPPFGGVAVIDLALVSFEVEFGTPLPDNLLAPPLEDFVTRQLAVPATVSDGVVLAATFSTDKGRGLTRVDFLAGRTSEPEQSDSAKQEGLDAPVRVAAEFRFAVRTVLPLNMFGQPKEAPSTLTGHVDLPLCNLADLDAKLSVTAPEIEKSRREWLDEYFPAALYGEPLTSAQAHQFGARQAVANVDSSHATMELVEGVVFDYRPKEPFRSPALSATEFEALLEDELYPLPLGWPQAPAAPRMPKPAITFSEAPLAVAFASRGPSVNRRQRALAALSGRTVPPLVVSTRAADLQRHVLPFATRGTSVTAPPAGVSITSPPASPARRPELFGVNLRVLPPAAPVAVGRRRLERLTRAARLERRTLTNAARPVRDLSAALRVDAGRALAIDVAGGQQNRIRLALTGTQIVRAIHLGGGGDVVGEAYVSGSGVLPVPPRTRRVVLIGEGSRVAVTAAGAGSAEVAIDSVGIEPDTTALALGPRTFAAHGCVLAANVTLPFPIDPLDSLPGRELLDHVTNARVHFPAIPTRWSLLIVVLPNTENPGRAVEEVRWASLDATLGPLATVIAPGRTAFIMPVSAPGKWTLDFDLGHHWRLGGLTVCPQSPVQLTAQLTIDDRWTFIDDSIVRPRAVATEVALEVNR